MKKGFTLIELLAVIIILAIVAVIATPMVLNSVNEAKDSIKDSKMKIYADSVKLYATENYFDNMGNLNGAIDNSSLNNNGVSCVSAYYYDSKVYLGNCTMDGEDGYYYIDGVVTKDPTTYNNIVDNLANYRDNSGANIPDLFNNMVAVKHTGTDWVVADLKSKWYDYDAKEWANAVVLNNGVSKNVGDIINVETEVKEMYVWIPRYKYTIFNDTADTTGVEAQEIIVTFEKNIEKTGTVSCRNSIGTQAISETCIDINGTIENGTSTYTHPAFTLGTTELTGIWVGKFENSNITSCTAISGSINTDCDLTTLGIQIKPNVTSWRGAKVGTLYTTIKALANQNNMSNADSHLIKNMEWGSIAYLTNSRYGRCTGETCTEISKNDSSTFLTGKSQGTTIPTSNNTVNGTYSYDTTEGKMASTTNNIYGIYDMSGGAWEYVMGNTAKDINTPIVGYNTTYNSGFKGNYFDGAVASGISAIFDLDNKYTNMYSYDATNGSIHSRGKLGDATKETLVTYGSSAGGWYDDNTDFAYSSDPWLARGGFYSFSTGAGIFIFNHHTGNACVDIASRTVLSRS